MEGLEEFHEVLCFSAEYSITFRLEDNSMFLTVIFDEFGREIDYPVKCSCNKLPVLLKWHWFTSWWM